MTATENRSGATISKREYQELANMLTVFQQLPQVERIAIQYYIKGRVDAEKSIAEIPMLIAHNLPRAAAH